MPYNERSKEDPNTKKKKKKKKIGTISNLDKSISTPIPLQNKATSIGIVQH